MNDLPTSQTSPNDIGTIPIASSQSSGGVPAKEKESMPLGGIEAPELTEIGHEAPLPPEVSATGVTGQFTTVSIPQNVQQMGVKPMGDNAAQAGALSVSLPLTDDQIAEGLHQGITSSWRWLAQWCLRRLKQVHLALKKIHGKFTRVKT